MAFATGYISGHVQLLTVYCAVRMGVKSLNLLSSTDITHAPVSAET